MIADPDGIYPELMAERFGEVAALADEQFRRPPPLPKQEHRRQRPLLADDEPWEQE